jgi:hypothetical protein
MSPDAHRISQKRIRGKMVNLRSGSPQGLEQAPEFLRHIAAVPMVGRRFVRPVKDEGLAGG